MNGCGVFYECWWNIKSLCLKSFTVFKMCNLEADKIWEKQKLWPEKEVLVLLSGVEPHQPSNCFLTELKRFLKCTITSEKQARFDFLCKLRLCGAQTGNRGADTVDRWLSAEPSRWGFHSFGQKSRSSSSLNALSWKAGGTLWDQPGNSCTTLRRPAGQLSQTKQLHPP